MEVFIKTFSQLMNSQKVKYQCIWETLIIVYYKSKLKQIGKC